MENKNQNTCNHCREIKDISSFNKNKNDKGDPLTRRYHSYCDNFNATSRIKSYYCNECYNKIYIENNYKKFNLIFID